MLTIKVEVPEDQKNGKKFINRIEELRRNDSIVVDKKYMIYKEIIEKDSIKISIKNFFIELKSNNIEIFDPLYLKF